MEDNGSGNEERDLDDYEDLIFAAAGEDEVEEEVVEDVVEPLVSSDVSDRVMETVNTAADGSKIKVKSEDDYLGLVELLEESNPRGLSVVYKSNLGHHSIAVR